jgi:hypothetical protein
MGFHKSMDLEFNHFPSIRRLPIGKEAKCKPETVMPESAVKQLFDGQRLIVEEKMNGTAIMFRADKNRFFLLAEDMRDFKPGLTGVYVIPTRFFLFDIFDRKKRRFVSFIEKADIFQSIRRNEIAIEEINSFNLSLVPLIAEGPNFRLGDIPAFLELKSRYAKDPKTLQPTYAEGVVVKPARELFLPEYEELVVKLIRNEYFFGQSGIAENYRRTHRCNKLKYNIINPSVDIDFDVLRRKKEYGDGTNKHDTSK